MAEKRSGCGCGGCLGLCILGFIGIGVIGSLNQRPSPAPEVASTPTAAPPPPAPTPTSSQPEEAAAEQAEIVRAAQAKAQQEQQQKKAEIFLATMRNAGVDESAIKSVSVGGSGDHTLTIVVGDSWHYQPYQVRFETAQNLWKGWAALDSPQDQDLSRIRITDYNDNEVGGSRVWAGSMIWVQDN